MKGYVLIDQEKFIKQQKAIIEGTNYVQLIAPCTKENEGICPCVDLDDIDEQYQYKIQSYSVVKFTPSSGAGSRMFKNIIESNSIVIKQLEESYNKLAFSNVFSFEEFLRKVNDSDLLSYPKGLLPFHKYNDVSKTAFEEHVIEGSILKTGANYHFTVSEKFILNFQDKIEQSEIKEFKDSISFSFQEEETNTIFLDENNEIVKDSNGDLMTRPGGHGSLINNLQKLDEDIIFIKNIDNVAHNSKNELDILYQKRLAVSLMDLIDERNKILSDLKLKREVTPESKKFINHYFNVEVDGLKLNDAISYLNRPVRVCGMVKNTGQPGGGPFWVKDEMGRISRQIVEMAQINVSDREQLEILEKSTHFNPVDIVCSIKDENKNKYQLSDFVNEKSSFISTKTLGGKKIKIYEHPGLWNGAMWGWITKFVEVPLSTFSPVKSIIDLLKENHLED